MIFNILKANRMIEELNTEKATLLKRLQETENAFNNLQDMSKDMTEASAEHAKVLEQLKTDHEKQIADIKAEYESKLKNLEIAKNEEATSAASKAADIVASLGVEPEAIKVQEKCPTKEEVLKKLESLKGQEQTDYYNKVKHIVWSK